MKKLFAFLAVAFTCVTALSAQTREVRMPNQPKGRPEYHSISQMEQGFWCAIEADLATSVMTQSRNMQSVGLQFVGGYRVSEFLRLGVGVGFRNYVNDNDVRYRDDAWAFPVFVNARGNISSQWFYHAVPFWSLSTGAAIRDGFFLQPNIGVRFGTQRNAATLQLGYRLQQMNTTYGLNDNALYNKNDNVNMVALTLGYEF